MTMPELVVPLITLSAPVAMFHFFCWVDLWGRDDCFRHDQNIFRIDMTTRQYQVDVQNYEAQVR